MASFEATSQALVGARGVLGDNILKHIHVLITNTRQYLSMQHMQGYKQSVSS